MTLILSFRIEMYDGYFFFILAEYVSNSLSLARTGWLSGERVKLMAWLRQLFFPAYFRLSPLQKHVREVVGGFGKKRCVSTGERKPGNTCASPTAMI